MLLNTVIVLADLLKSLQLNFRVTSNCVVSSQEHSTMWPLFSAFSHFLGLNPKERLNFTVVLKLTQLLIEQAHGL